MGDRDDLQRRSVASDGARERLTISNSIRSNSIRSIGSISSSSSSSSRRTRDSHYRQHTGTGGSSVDVNLIDREHDDDFNHYLDSNEAGEFSGNDAASGSGQGLGGGTGTESGLSPLLHRLAVEAGPGLSSPLRRSSGLLQSVDELDDSVGDGGNSSIDVNGGSGRGSGAGAGALRDSESGHRLLVGQSRFNCWSEDGFEEGFDDEMHDEDNGTGSGDGSGGGGSDGGGIYSFIAVGKGNCDYAPKRHRLVNNRLNRAGSGSSSGSDVGVDGGTDFGCCRGGWLCSCSSICSCSSVERIGITLLLWGTSMVLALRCTNFDT